jgi:hypothetical protein
MRSGIALLGMCMAVLAIHCTASAAPFMEGIDTIQDGKSMRASSSDPDWRNGNADSRPIAAGETLTLAELEGPGVIRHFWNTIAPGELGYPRLLVLRMYWDGEESPSVECPIGDFFGVGHGLDSPFTSAPVVVSSEGRARNCYWPMPFRKSARIAVTNEGGKPVPGFFWHIDWEKVPALAPDRGYFHALYRQETPALSGANYTIAEIEGKGHYVGTVLSVRQRTAGWWGEGDDFFFIDGSGEPVLRGTGTEDYFCDAWGLRRMSAPWYGVTLYEGGEAGARGSCYRWHVPDPVRFEESLRVEIEHKGSGLGKDGETLSGFVERRDDFSSAAFWYQREPHGPREALPPAKERLGYDPENLVEAESVKEEITISTGTLHEQMGPWSGSRQLRWNAAEEGGKLELPFEVAATGGYRITLVLTQSWDYGVFDIRIDGKHAGPQRDLYYPAFRSRQFRLPAMPLTAGAHTLSFENEGRNIDSRGFLLGIDAILVSPAAEN